MEKQETFKTLQEAFDNAKEGQHVQALGGIFIVVDCLPRNGMGCPEYFEGKEE